MPGYEGAWQDHIFCLFFRHPSLTKFCILKIYVLYLLKKNVALRIRDSKAKLIMQGKHNICCFLLFTLDFLHHDFACASLTDWTVCMSSCIVYRQKVSRRCVRACEISNYWSDCKSSCTAYMQGAFLQYV